MLETTPEEDIELQINGMVLVELFGYRDSRSFYHPYVLDLSPIISSRFIVPKSTTRSLYHSDVNRDGGAYIGSPDRLYLSSRITVMYYNEGIRILDDICKERCYSEFTTTSIHQWEEEGDSLAFVNGESDERVTRKDDEYEQRLKKVSYLMKEIVSIVLCQN